jgi:hypothetical protein
LSEQQESSALKRPAVWSASQYVRPIAVVTEGRRASTHLAEIRSPIGVPLRAYVKHFPDHIPRGVFNEVFGYVVMSAMGVPQPQVALMPAPLQVRSDKPWLWAFVSCEPRPTTEGTAKQLYDIENAKQHAKLVKRLFSCPALPLLIAADQLLRNGDRNIGNLVFRSKQSFVAIDHSEILGGGEWNLGDLWFAQTWERSLLIEALVDMSTLEPSMRSAIYGAAQSVAAKFFELQGQLRDALDCSNSVEAAVAMDAVWWRCISLAGWFQERLGLVA